MNQLKLTVSMVCALLFAYATPAKAQDGTMDVENATTYINFGGNATGGGYGVTWNSYERQVAIWVYGDDSHSTGYGLVDLGGMTVYGAFWGASEGGCPLIPSGAYQNGGATEYGSYNYYQGYWYDDYYFDTYYSDVNFQTYTGGVTAYACSDDSYSPLYYGYASTSDTASTLYNGQVSFAFN